MPKENVNLMTWMATERDPGLLANVLACAQKKYTVNKIFYLYTNGSKSRNKDLEDNLNFIRLKFPNIVDIPVDINNPASHSEVYDKIQEALTPHIGEMQNLMISTTAGTPAMHAVWLVLYAGGFFPLGTKLFSAQIAPQKEKKLFREKEVLINDSQRLQEIDFKIDTYLSAIRLSQQKIREKENIHKYVEPKSKITQDVYNDILRFSKVPNAPLIIFGERGTGKSSAVYDWIRSLKASLRNEHEIPIVSINCGSLDPVFAEAQIFGYVGGAYTGGNRKGESGLIERARGGILFLDEIQDLKKEVQRKLLKVLNDHCYRKFGDHSNNEISIKFDLICATNVSEREIRERLDSDFFDRICIYKVTFPPLRERREDIEDLWKNVWCDVCAESRITTSWERIPYSESLKNYFQTSQLHGNIRSLRKLAYLKIAYGDEKTDAEIVDMVAADDFAENKQVESSLEQLFSKCEDVSWVDAGAIFRKEIAEWIEKKYGTIAEADKATGWGKKNLMNAKKFKG